jgi:LysM repeat protein
VTNTSWTINIDQLLLSEAQERAQLENQDLDEVVQRLLRKWVSSPSSAYDVYSVQPGDSLAQIASKFYGDAQLYTSLAQLNGLAGSSILRVGQKLRIPPLGDLPPAPSPRAAPEVRPELPAGLEIEYIQSPHYNERPPDARIWAIVVHATANDSLNGVIEWFTNPQSLVSAHYNIDKDGRVVQMAREEQRAWHAGKSQWKGIESVNDFSIGIELVNRNDGADPYPEEQYQVCLKLCKYLVAKYGIQAEDIMSHRAISLTGKTDPAGFDMDRLRRDVAAG